MAARSAARWSFAANIEHDPVKHLYDLKKSTIEQRSRLPRQLLEGGEILISKGPSAGGKELLLEVVAGGMLAVAILAIDRSVGLSLELVNSSLPVSWLVLAVCSGLAILGGAARQFMRHLISNALALPITDSHGQPSVMYIGDLPSHNNGRSRQPSAPHPGWW